MSTKKLLYVHGYGSSGNAFKANLLREMFPEYTLVAPTIDYNREQPDAIYRKLTQLVSGDTFSLIVGSSMGGFFSLCITHATITPILAINPVTNAAAVLERVATPDALARAGVSAEQADTLLAAYRKFQCEVFDTIAPAHHQLNFALSADDETLGSHAYLEQLFPDYGTKVVLDKCGHIFQRFAELKPEIEALLARPCRDGSA